MAAIRLDHPVLVSGEQIRRREFVTTRRGYDADQVRQYLEELAAQVDLMGSMIREARLEAETAARAGAQPQADPYDELARRAASVLREADDTAERLLTQGRLEADRLLTEARREADRIRAEAETAAERARAEAERALDRAREEAGRTIAGLADRRQAVVDQLAQMQERLLGVARQLESAIEAPPASAAGMPAAPAAAVLPPSEPEEAASTPDDGKPRDDGGSPQAQGAIVDVRDEANPGAPLIVADEVLEAAAETAPEGLWDGTDAIQLDLPDIPPLDLSWDAPDGEDDLPT